MGGNSQGRNFPVGNLPVGIHPVEISGPTTGISKLGAQDADIISQRKFGNLKALKQPQMSSKKVLNDTRAISLFKIKSIITIMRN